MAVRVERPAGAPHWWDFVAFRLEELIDRIDRSTVKFLRRDFTYLDDGLVLSLGSVPANGLILKEASGVQVETVFNAGTLNEVDIGTAADGDLYGTNLSLGAVGFVPLDENVAGYRVSVATEITATVNLTGAAAATGAAAIIITYVTLPATR